MCEKYALYVLCEHILRAINIQEEPQTKSLNQTLLFEWFTQFILD